MATAHFFLLCMITILSLQTVHSSTSTPCGIFKSVVHDIDIGTNLIDNGWTNCYFAPYSDATEVETLLTNCKTGDNYYLFVGAKQTSSSTNAYIGAYAPSQVLTEYTSSSLTAYKPYIFQDDTTYNVYWYNFGHKSFGFASQPNIRLFSADTFNGTDNNRLSWEAHHGHGGYRAGNAINLDDDVIWQKIVYYKHCICTVSKYVMNEYPVSNLINNGWISCYIVPYFHSTSMAALRTYCPIGTNYYLFIGALETSASDTVYVGAYGPSQILATDTTSGTMAFKPNIFENDEEYGVYWYNKPEYSFGFASHSIINLNTGDTENLGTNQRLSWHIRDTTAPFGGYRAGPYILNRNTIWHKVIYYNYCTKISYIGSNNTIQTIINPTINPTTNPTIPPTTKPTTPPTTKPIISPTIHPTTKPTTHPITAPTPTPTSIPTPRSTSKPTRKPTATTPTPTALPHIQPTPTPNPTTTTPETTPTPRTTPTGLPTPTPTTTSKPTSKPTASPTTIPTTTPTLRRPLSIPYNPASSPIYKPTDFPTINPTPSPTNKPVISPTPSPFFKPTAFPTVIPTSTPTKEPTKEPTKPISAGFKTLTLNPTSTSIINESIGVEERSNDNNSISLARNIDIFAIAMIVAVWCCILMLLIGLIVFYLSSCKRNNGYIETNGEDEEE